MECPRCRVRMVSVSALTHGCELCGHVWFMVNGRLHDGGPWEVKRGWRYVAEQVSVVVARVLLLVVVLCALVGFYLMVRSLL